LSVPSSFNPAPSPTNTELPPSFRDILPVIPTSSLKVPVVPDMPPVNVPVVALNDPSITASPETFKSPVVAIFPATKLSTVTAPASKKFMDAVPSDINCSLAVTILPVTFV